MGCGVELNLLVKTMSEERKESLYLTELFCKLFSFNGMLGCYLIIDTQEKGGHLLTKTLCLKPSTVLQIPDIYTRM